jgi:hypothetical protein
VTADKVLKKLDATNKWVASMKCNGIENYRNPETLSFCKLH